MSTTKALLALALVSAVFGTSISCSTKLPDPVCPQMERVLAAMPSRPEEGFESKEEQSLHEHAVRVSMNASGVPVDSSEFVAELCSCLPNHLVDALIAKYGTDRVMTLLSRSVWVARDLGDAASGATLIRVQISAGEDPKYLAYTAAHGGIRAENGVAWTVQLMQQLWSQDAVAADTFIRCMLANPDDTRSTQELLEQVVETQLEFDREVIDDRWGGYAVMYGTRPLMKLRS